MSMMVKKQMVGFTKRKNGLDMVTINVEVNISKDLIDWITSVTDWSKSKAASEVCDIMIENPENYTQWSLSKSHNGKGPDWYLDVNEGKDLFPADVYPPEELEIRATMYGPKWDIHKDQEIE